MSAVIPPLTLAIVRSYRPCWDVDYLARVAASLPTELSLAEVLGLPDDVVTPADRVRVVCHHLARHDRSGLVEFAAGCAARARAAVSVAAYYAALGSGRAWPDAFESAFGLSVDDFYANFAAYLKSS